MKRGETEIDRRWATHRSRKSTESKYMNRFLLISLGAILGANARYLVGLWAAQRFGTAFPYGTAIVNITGSLVLGFLLAWGSIRTGLSPEMRLFAAVGFLGAYTTFSSFAVESLLQAENVSLVSALSNIIVNNGLGIGAAAIGMWVARTLVTG
jgi:CrcB protein